MLEQIATWSASVKDAEDVVAFNTKGRDKAILEALSAGVGPTAIAKASGLARSRIYQIKG